jgi:GNAT superfamily N-acetyltransferase
MNIVLAISEPAIQHVRQLFREYAASLSFTLCFQGFEEQLASLPGKYGAPHGRLLVATGKDGAALGCFGLRPLDESTAEIKRLYVRPAFRGDGTGRKLMEYVLDEAKSIGYRRVPLDTVASMVEANRLYDALGFREIVPYCENPLPGARFLEKSLTP